MSTKSKHHAAVAMPRTADTAAFAAAVQAEVSRLIAERGMSAEMPKPPSELPPDLQRNRLYDAATVAAMLNYSLAHFRRMYRAGKIPPPVRVNGRKLGWPGSVLQDLVTPRQTAA